MEHVGIVVDDLAAATEFFVDLGLVLEGEAPVEGRWVDRIVALEGVRADVAIMQTPDGNGRLELTKFHAPPAHGDNRDAAANTPGIRHIAFAVEDIDAVVAGLRARGAELVGELERYEDSYRLCYVDVLTWFDLHTSVAPPAPTANWSHVEDGRITTIQVTFDARPLAPPGG